MQLQPPTPATAGQSVSEFRIGQTRSGAEFSPVVGVGPQKGANSFSTPIARKKQASVAQRPVPASPLQRAFFDEEQAPEQEARRAPDYAENSSLHRQLALENQYLDKIYHDPYILVKTYNFANQTAGLQRKSSTHQLSASSPWQQAQQLSAIFQPQDPLREELNFSINQFSQNFIRANHQPQDRSYLNSSLRNAQNSARGSPHTRPADKDLRAVPLDLANHFYLHHLQKYAMQTGYDARAVRQNITSDALMILLNNFDLQVTAATRSAVDHSRNAKTLTVAVSYINSTVLDLQNIIIIPFVSRGNASAKLGSEGRREGGRRIGSEV